MYRPREKSVRGGGLAVVAVLAWTMVGLGGASPASAAVGHTWRFPASAGSTTSLVLDRSEDLDAYGLRTLGSARASADAVVLVAIIDPAARFGLVGGVLTFAGWRTPLPLGPNLVHLLAHKKYLVVSIVRGFSGATMATSQTTRSISGQRNMPEDTLHQKTIATNGSLPVPALKAGRKGYQIVGYRVTEGLTAAKTCFNRSGWTCWGDPAQIVPDLVVEPPVIETAENVHAILRPVVGPSEATFGIADMITTAHGQTVFAGVIAYPA